MKILDEKEKNLDEEKAKFEALNTKNFNSLNLGEDLMNEYIITTNGEKFILIKDLIDLTQRNQFKFKSFLNK